MKKIWISLFFICIFMMSLIVVNADMGAPEIRPYFATPRSVDGAVYYDFIYDDYGGKYEEVGKINYGEIVRIIYEADYNGVKYGQFEKSDEGKFDFYFVDLGNMHITNENEESIHGTTDIPMISLSENLEIHKGPSFIYDVVGSIPMQEQFVGYRLVTKDQSGNIFEESMIPWLYVEYKGVSGWVCELNSAVGSYNDEELITMRDLILEDGTVAVPASTIIKGFYQTDPWSEKAFISYGNNNYFINLYDCGVQTNDGEWFKNRGKINYDGAKLYRIASINSDVLVGNIPNGTELELKYIQWNFRWISWAYAEYNGVGGWIVVFDSDEAREQYLKDGEGAYESEKATATIFKSGNNSEDKQKESQEKIDEKPHNVDTTAKSDDILIPSSILYIGIALIVALTAIVIILLIDKKK